jgi:thioredoxin 1
MKLTHLDVDHIKIEDGSGKKLGRSFDVKNWPTLIFMKDGKEIDRLVKQIDSEELRSCLQSISTGELDHLMERELPKTIKL